MALALEAGPQTLHRIFRWEQSLQPRLLPSAQFLLERSQQVQVVFSEVVEAVEEGGDDNFIFDAALLRRVRHVAGRVGLSLLERRHVDVQVLDVVVVCLLLFERLGVLSDDAAVLSLLALPLLPHFLSVENLVPDQVHHVAQQHRLDFLVEGARAGERGRNVDLEQPGFEVGVDQHVEPVYFKALVLVLGGASGGDDGGLDGHEGLEAEVFDVGVDFAVVDAHLLVLVLELLETPLGLDRLPLLVLRLLLAALLLLVFVLDVVLALLVDRVVREVDEPLLQTVLRGRVGLGGQPNQAVLENVGFEGVEGGDDDVDSEIVLEPPEQVGLGDVLRHEEAAALGDQVLLADDLDAPAAAGACGFEDVHVFEVVHFSVVAEALVVLGENVGERAQLEVLPVLPPLLLHVAPQVGLAADAPGSGEVVDLLELVHVLELGRPDESGPEAVPRGGAVA